MDTITDDLVKRLPAICLHFEQYKTELFKDVIKQINENLKIPVNLMELVFTAPGQALLLCSEPRRIWSLPFTCRYTKSGLQWQFNDGPQWYQWDWPEHRTLKMISSKVEWIQHLHDVHQWSVWIHQLAGRIARHHPRLISRKGLYNKLSDEQIRRILPARYMDLLDHKSLIHAMNQALTIHRPLDIRDTDSLMQTLYILCPHKDLQRCDEHALRQIIGNLPNRTDQAYHTLSNIQLRSLLTALKDNQHRQKRRPPHEKIIYKLITQYSS
ncbi:MAG: hypothetical protein GF313_09165 [Caldithrix sp.]|nr:hypothetical protein [Caldithrix sp.]